MGNKLRGFGEIDQRTGERRSNCVITPVPPSPVCNEKMERLREYIDTRFQSEADALVQRTKVIDFRLDNLNGEQERLDKDRQDFLRAGEYRIEHKNLSDKVDILIRWQSYMEGKASRANLISVIAMITASLFALIHIVQSILKI